MTDKTKENEPDHTTHDDSSPSEDNRGADAERFTGDAEGERGYRGDSAADTPPGSVPGGSHGGGSGHRQGGFESGESEAPLADERQEWRDGVGAYGVPGYDESRAAGARSGYDEPRASRPRSGYGEQGFGAGENQGGRWGGGDRGGYGGGNPGGVHGTCGGSWAAAGERFEQGRGPRSHGPDGWGGAGPTPGGRDAGWGRGSFPGNRPEAGRAAPHQHEGSHGVNEPPWRQSEFAGRGEFGDSDRGMWTEDRAYSSHADPEHGAARPDRWSVPGPFSGRGPRDYRRSESAIRDDVCERLTRHGHIDASNVRVEVENGEVLLEGTVASRQVKRMAEDIAETVAGVRDIHNRLRIRRSAHDFEDRIGSAGR